MTEKARLRIDTGGDHPFASSTTTLPSSAFPLALRRGERRELQLQTRCPFRFHWFPSCVTCTAEVARACFYMWREGTPISCFKQIDLDLNEGTVLQGPVSLAWYSPRSSRCVLRSPWRRPPFFSAWLLRFVCPFLWDPVIHRRPAPWGSARPRGGHTHGFLEGPFRNPQE